ncbi:hypothetical protein PTTG_02040 [Puccinia triticina 1-1 BBBD Race 1]|uniref:Uncharacterized protein n=2 Tax=Puccinia triticina TaxID=208348 RepID=A0A180GJU5_PUCT1|nr:uncharacterized protein PtA15_14A276 [Puccinia triticina]OAV92871.1 hypothetical protein PTTG_02040 [Puccinia triticina 1-1 BBBD Race 1]WAQ91393.1 hypothetical protein PtA15_14A276 [Puccinia triticina]WAR62192.1 hypothetical protein PtB15_14B287 [Puccinia triticina]
MDCLRRGCISHRRAARVNIVTSPSTSAGAAETLPSSVQPIGNNGVHDLVHTPLPGVLLGAALLVSSRRLGSPEIGQRLSATIKDLPDHRSVQSRAQSQSRSKHTWRMKHRPVAYIVCLTVLLADWCVGTILDCAACGHRTAHEIPGVQFEAPCGKLLLPERKICKNLRRKKFLRCHRSECLQYSRLNAGWQNTCRHYFKEHIVPPFNNPTVVKPAVSKKKQPAVPPPASAVDGPSPSEPRKKMKAQIE